ncbi:MAG: hypothetical protein IJD56_06615, partial [Peptococcaceae bacterium]|nr:hypothetical protein [Peptococcaceae bacterium]
EPACQICLRAADIVLTVHGNKYFKIKNKEDKEHHKDRRKAMRKALRIEIRKEYRICIPICMMAHLTGC